MATTAFVAMTAVGGSGRSSNAPAPAAPPSRLTGGDRHLHLGTLRPDEPFAASTIRASFEFGGAKGPVAESVAPAPVAKILRWSRPRRPT